MTRGAFNQELKMCLRSGGRNPNGKPYKSIKQLKKRVTIFLPQDQLLKKKNHRRGLNH